MADNDNSIISLDELNATQKNFGIVYSDGGVPVDFMKVAVIALTVREQFATNPVLFGGAPEIFPDPEDPTRQCFVVRDAAVWACTQTEFGSHLPDLVKSTGACFRRQDGMAFLISALARDAAFAAICAERFNARIDPVELLEEKLVGYLEQHGYRLVFEVLQKASTPEESCTMMMHELRELSLDHHLETVVGTRMPISGLTRFQFEDVLDDWMGAHYTSVQQLLGDMPEFGAEHE